MFVRWPSRQKSNSEGGAGMTYLVLSRNIVDAGSAACSLSLMCYACYSFSVCVCVVFSSHDTRTAVLRKQKYHVDGEVCRSVGRWLWWR